MKCPFCKGDKTQVVDTRESEDGDSIRRRRRCLTCDKRFTTYEMVELRMPQVVKQNGMRSEFDEEKLRTSFKRALHKRRIEYASEIGAAAYGLVGGGRMRTRPPNAAEIKDLAGLCEDLAVYGSGLGVTVAYHPHTGCTVETEAEIDALMNESQALTLCLDASHIALVGEDPVSHLRKYRARTGYIHLKDWADGAFTEMGRGKIGIDFPAVLRELEAQQFAHWVVIEQSRSDVSPLRSAQVNADYLRSIGYPI